MALRQRLSAALLDHAEPLLHRAYGGRKQVMFADLPDTVLEIGPGPGANLRYYRPGTRLVAVEPSEPARRRLERRARRRRVDLDLHDLAGEGLPFADRSHDVVVCTLVLCSVDDPERVLAEARRVLRPGGRFLFCEHVVAREGTPTRRLQSWLRSPWHWLTEGCHLDRPTGELIAAAGFSGLERHDFCLGPAAGPARPHVWGTAVR
ncbi:methyltransferase domain-containing protein [bacterium]|nr:methyltransferase domain-containing protein [bacterium]